MYPPPCVHGDGTGLCPGCRADHDEDPAAWLEFGDHPAGIARWAAEQEQIARDAAAAVSRPADPSAPF
jgi:hypothetical protein